MTDQERLRAAAARYLAATHAMQSGVKYDQESGSTDGTSKHLRVGVNSALASQQGLVNLLIQKGVITSVEYHEAMADAMEEEVRRYEKLLTEKLGTIVTLL